MAQMNKTREELAKRFLELLNSDDKSSWKRGWKRLSVAKNGSSGYEYKGVNQFLLSLVALDRGYNDGRWFTFKQANDAGYKIKKGEKSTPVEFWSYYDTVTKKNLNITEVRDILKDNPERNEDIKPVSQIYAVFNAAQLEGIEPEPELKRDDFSNNQIAKEFTGNLLNAFGIDLVHGGDRAFYSVTKDEIHMPHQTQFFSEYEYYATMLHELAHSTGAEKRLNRDLSGGFGSERYAMEELRAEITSCFLSNSIGADIDTEEHIQNHEAYVSSWIKRITDKPEELFRAVKDAENIAKYMEEQGSLEKVLEKYPALNQEVVGRIYYFDNQGKVAEYVDYKDKERFKDAIREDLNTGITIKVEDRTEDKVYLNEVMKIYGGEPVEDMDFKEDKDFVFDFARLEKQVKSMTSDEPEMSIERRAPRRYSMNSEGEMQRTFNGKLPEEMSLEDQLRFAVENDILLNGKISQEVQDYLEANGYRYESGKLVKLEETFDDKLEDKNLEISYALKNRKETSNSLYSDVSDVLSQFTINELINYHSDVVMKDNGNRLRDFIETDIINHEIAKANEYAYNNVIKEEKPEGFDRKLGVDDMLNKLCEEVSPKDKQLSDNKTQTFNNVVKMGRSL